MIDSSPTDCLRPADGSTIVYLSPVPCYTFTQRPHAFIEHFRSRGVQRILWVDPYPTRLLATTDLMRLTKRDRESGDPHDDIEVLRVRALPIEPLVGIRALNAMPFLITMNRIERFIQDSKHRALVIGKPSQLAYKLLRKFAWDFSMYDAMDHFPYFYSGLARQSMANVEANICKKVSAIISSSRSIADRLNLYRSELVLNACAPESLPKSVPLRSETPVIGYVGTIAHWFDWPLVMGIAREFPEIRIRLIGPIITPPPGRVPDNVEILGPHSHADAMAQVACFDVGLIPFLLSPLTEGVDPVKYYEYRALGLPVVSTRFGEMAHRHNALAVYFTDQSPRKAVVDALACRRLAGTTGTVSWNERFAASETLNSMARSLGLDASHQPSRFEIAMYSNIIAS